MRKENNSHFVQRKKFKVEDFPLYMMEKRQEKYKLSAKLLMDQSNKDSSYLIKIQSSKWDIKSELQMYTLFVD